jgi:hypothetical protein
MVRHLLLFLIIVFSIFYSFYILLELILCVILLAREKIFLFVWMIEFLVEFGVVMLRYHN